MIRLIYGKKGSGKSKRLLDMANAEVTASEGDIVYIDDDTRYMYDLKHEIRFVNTRDYAIDCPEKLYGLVCGMIAQDYDIASIYIDGVKNIVKKNAGNLEKLLKELDSITKKFDVKTYVVISGEPDSMPEYLKSYVS